MATTKDLLEQYKKKRQKIEAMAGPDAIEKRHKEGQWTAGKELTISLTRARSLKSECSSHTVRRLSDWIKEKSCRWYRHRFRQGQR